MSIYTSPYRNLSYIHLNPKEHNAISPLQDKQQGVRKLSDGWCNICNRPTHYQNQELCHVCRNHLIRGTLFIEYGELKVTKEDNHQQYNYLVSDGLVQKIDNALNGNFKTRTYANKTAKIICIFNKFMEAKGDIEIDVCYRRLRYYANTSTRGSLQQTLQDGKKVFDILNRYLYF